MSKDILALAREAIEDDRRATPGPWTCGASPTWCIPRVSSHADLEFIAAARDREPKLAAYVLKLHDDVAKYDAACNEQGSFMGRLLAERDALKANLAAMTATVDAIQRARDNEERLYLEDRVRLAAVTAARNTACEIAEAATHAIDNALCVRCRSSIDNVDVEQIDALRAIGTAS